MHSEGQTALKDVLRRFVHDHAQGPRDVAEREFSDLLLFMVRLADKVGIDLFAAARDRVMAGSDQRAGRLA
jgi:hypothetical protein